ncbi:hypothetical protein AgCh_035885 [Apium graveolens]
MMEKMIKEAMEWVEVIVKENPGMDLESLMEEEDKLKTEKVTSKSEASGKKPLPKLKGIVIKERTHSEATLARSQPQIDPRSKGKEKVGEPIKSQETVSSDILKKKVTSDIAQVNLISEDRPKTLLPGFTKAKQTQPLKTAASGFEARVVTGKEARDKTGLGSVDERRIHNTTNDPTSLSEPGIGATPERLNQLESVQMVYHTYLKEYILLYFMTDGRVYNIRQNAIPLKYFEELEHVLFLLQVDDRITGTATNYLKDQIQRQKRLYSVKSDSIYVPKYRDHKDDIVEMKPNYAQIITTFLGYRAVEFNLESDKAYLIRLDQDIRKAKINDLRAAIFQIGEDTAELKDAKRRMIDELRYAERFVYTTYAPDLKSSARKALLIEKGKGIPLKDIPNVLQAQALDLIGPVYSMVDSFVGVREKTSVLFAYGFLLMKQQNLQEARLRLANGLQKTHVTLGNLQLVAQYLTVLGNLALSLHDTGQA